MDKITNKDKINELKERARDRYYSIGRDDSHEIFIDNALLCFHSTSDGLNYHVVEIDAADIDSTDIGNLLKWAFHDIKDRTAEKAFDDVIFTIMGAIKEEALDDDLKNADMYISLDCGYVIPGLLDYVAACEVENEEYSHEYTSATYGSYSPSNPWNAPGMCVSDFI